MILLDSYTGDGVHIELRNDGHRYLFIKTTRLRRTEWGCASLADARRLYATEKKKLQ
ncbi:hypothetical protein [Changpingibacter yushuensis]|uniref:hypothetical protein n=1 Tax=Changpingibacter yushuensis TaxID=2758440 RepID=UPI00165D7C6C|nr:hypothetical protein [Changpingibacter yushuensis]